MRMDKNFDKIFNVKENLHKIKKRNKEKLVASKFFTPVENIQKFKMPDKKPVMTKNLKKSREMYRDKIISSEEVSRKKIKLDKEKTAVASRADVAAGNAENEEEFFEKLKLNYERDKAQGLLTERFHQKKVVKKVKKLFNDDCVKLMNNFKDARKNVYENDKTCSGDSNVRSLPGHQPATDDKSNESSADNYSTKNNYPKMNIKNNSYVNFFSPIPEYQKLSGPSTSSFSFLSEPNISFSDIEKDNFMMNLTENSRSINLPSQITSPSMLSRAITDHVSSDLSRFRTSKLIMDKDNQSVCSLPCSQSLSFNINNNNSQKNSNNRNSTVGSNKLHLPDYLFKK
ncbi:GATA zinc finger domain-containing protein 8-like [Microplitis mediator]|uniref:GATA zinc finger domain-containing protein 8-like n=1 Tax=Microplitis mediator TaxID=375433 RepID=UPI00255682D2|nr:GATA zinc finger domain-containing protein 8-like [Microplitis mediator]